ncbi:MAG: bifunctional proline dehydrogenase/L-glutamate gamma-semialdehyde dehydrogenase PutA [Pseudomonadota bacterium]
MLSTDPTRAQIAALHRMPEDKALAALIARAAPDPALRRRAETHAADLIRALRSSSQAGLMEAFLAEYGLSSREGIALMCLAEALLRVPDAATIDALIEDKIAPSSWGAHLGGSSSVLVNASTWALMLTGKVLQEPDDGLAGTLRSAVKRLGEPVVRAAVGRAMREMGSQFVLGETIQAATERAAMLAAKGYSYSYDMLGEAALTAADADAFYAAYLDAIAALAPLCRADDIRDNPGISIKLSALHPRYEELQRHQLPALIERVSALALAAAAAGMGLNIDAEEAERLEVSLDVIKAVLADPRLARWVGFGVVVQAYGKRAPRLIDWLHGLAQHHDRRIMVRLVKGAYWDREIKRAQVEGLAEFPVYTRKSATDAAYLCCARLLLDRADRIYPQFATHNAHSVATILEMANGEAFEFQRLHGMGEALHEIVRAAEATRCRIYAPVGAHRDLLAYLVRRLLENGANSSFVHQVLDPAVAPEIIAACPFDALDAAGPNAAVSTPSALFAPRVNSRGWDLWDRADLADVEGARDVHRRARWMAGEGFSGATHTIVNPADPGDIVGQVTEAGPADLTRALDAARPWQAEPAVLRRAADLYEARHGELFSLLTREAGKTLTDAVAELREAVDFLRYYADEAARLTHPTLGLVTCISPWNFPLAIFTGQIAAALAAGNGVLAKPAEATPLIAARAVALLHEAGVPQSALQLLPGQGLEVGQVLTSDPRIAGVAFTGSTATAQAIHRTMADHLDPSTPLIAETGGLNAMIVDSTALPEQAVRDIITSAFRSAGQRCSALRILYLQDDIAKTFLTMLEGAMAELIVAPPHRRASDLGPVISQDARAEIDAYIAAAKAEGRLLKQLPTPQQGHFVGPALIDLPGGISALEHEVFGPVLHVTTFKAHELGAVVDDINARGFGLTFGIHSRIDDRVQTVSDAIRAGNVYVNRNQIGAIVGSQPFGGEGLSGTGPKAGGPEYVARFTRSPKGEASHVRNPQGEPSGARSPQGEPAAGAASTDRKNLSVALSALPTPSDAALTAIDLPGPTGEANRLTTHPRGKVLCAGPGDAAHEQARLARDAGCTALAHGAPFEPEILASLTPLDAVIWWGDAATARAMRQALSQRTGALIPLITEADPAPRLILERHLCIDTTAAGGNAKLLAEAG